MAISYQSEMKDGLLCITAAGRDDTMQQVVDYGTAVIDLAIKNEAKMILCDERNLEYDLRTFETFQVAEFIAERAPKVARIAIVCKPAFLVDGKFWETVAVNRFLHVRVDTDIDQVRNWLLSPES